MPAWWQRYAQPFCHRLVFAQGWGSGAPRQRPLQLQGHMWSFSRPELEAHSEERMLPLFLPSLPKQSDTKKTKVFLNFSLGSAQRHNIRDSSQSWKKEQA